MNLIFIEILRKLSTNMTETLQQTMTNKMMIMLSSLMKEVGTIKQDTTKQLQDSKKAYMDELGIIIMNQTMTNIEKMTIIGEKNLEKILDKTKILMNEVIPQCNDRQYQLIDQTMKAGMQSMLLETKNILDMTQKDETNVCEYLHKIEIQMQTIQQPILSVINNSQESTTCQLQQLKDNLTMQQQIQSQLADEMNQFLNKYKYNSSSKGAISEVELYGILQQLFPIDEIIDCRGETAACDYLVNRIQKSKPSILFENKDYKQTVNTDEVYKFIRDVKHQKKHGIFISQNSPITFKEPYQIDIEDNLIMVYIPNAQYNVERIKVAVEIIDMLSQYYLYAHTKITPMTLQLTQEDLDNALKEYLDFVKHKQELVDMMDKNHKETTCQLEKIQMMNLKQILVKNGLVVQEQELRCQTCNTFIGKNKASLGAHIRRCKGIEK